MKYIKTFEKFIEKPEELNERLGAPTGGFTKKDIEKLLKRKKDIEFFANGKTLFIAPYMHRNGLLDDADNNTFFAVDADGEEYEVAFKDIEFIES